MCPLVSVGWGRRGRDVGDTWESAGMPRARQPEERPPCTQPMCAFLLPLPLTQELTNFAQDVSSGIK